MPQRLQAVAPLSPNARGTTGRTFSAAWGAKTALTVALVVPELVVEVRADVSQDSAGRWRHPVKLVRLRDDLAAADVPFFGDATPSH